MRSKWWIQAIVIIKDKVNRLFQVVQGMRLQWFYRQVEKLNAERVAVVGGRLKQVSDALRTYVSQRFSDVSWFKQFDEATAHNVRLTTFVSTFFINILALAFPLTLMQVYDRIVPNRSYSTLSFLAFGVVIAVVIQVILQIARSYVNLWADTRYEYRLNKTAFSYLMNAPLYIYEETDVGMRLKQFSVLDQVRGFYNNQLLIALFEIPFLFIFFIIIAYIGGILFLVPLGVVILTGYLSFRYMQSWKFYLKKKLTYESREGDFTVNVLTNIHTVKSLGMEDLLTRRYERLQQSGMFLNYESNVHSGDLTSLKTISSQLAIVLVGSVGALLVINGDMAIGGLAACILLSGRIMLPVSRLLSAFTRLRMLNIIRLQIDTVLRMPVGAENQLPGFSELEGEIQLRKLGYYYEDEGRKQWILRDITARIPPKTAVSIIGNDRAANSILLNILATITRPTDGEYLLDARNVDHYQTYLLREKIAYLSKSGKLLHGTIMDNLSAFNERLIPVARRFSEQLGLSIVISKLPAGYDTEVGDKAVEALPGGIINLIFIIRALTDKPKIILFDEANINLDVQTTKKMLELLRILKEVATVIILSTSEMTQNFSDIVYELKDGMLTEVKRHEQSEQ